MPDPMDQRGSWDLVCLQRTLVALISQQDRRLPTPHRGMSDRAQRNFYFSVPSSNIHTSTSHTLRCGRSPRCAETTPWFLGLMRHSSRAPEPNPYQQLNAPTRVTSPRHRARQCCRLCESILITNLIPTQPVWD